MLSLLNIVIKSSLILLVGMVCPFSIFTTRRLRMSPAGVMWIPSIRTRPIWPRCEVLRVQR